MSNATAVFHGVEVPESLLSGEIQNHTAKTLSEARTMAGRALAARAVLLEKASKLGLEPEPECNAEGQEETTEEALIRAVLSEEVNVESPAEETVTEFYNTRPDAFRSPPLIEASHILIAPTEATAEAAEDARKLAETLISDLQSRPEGFVRLAASSSACPSASEGGKLGQLRPGDVLDVIWEALNALEVGEIAAEPVLSEHGWHILRLEHRSSGARLPFEYVRPHIEFQLETKSWTSAAAHYVDDLLSHSASSPGLVLNADGSLDDGTSTLVRADNLLGSALADAEKALESLSDDARACVEVASNSRNELPSEILVLAIHSFISQAKDEDWTQLVSVLRDSKTPLTDSLRLIVAHELPPLRKKHTLIRMRNGVEDTS